MVRARDRTCQGSFDNVDDDSRGSPAATESKKSRGNGARVESPNPAKQRRSRALGFKGLMAEYEAINLMRMSRVYVACNSGAAAEYVCGAVAESGSYMTKIMNST